MFEGLLNTLFQKDENLLRIPEGSVKILSLDAGTSVAGFGTPVFLTEEEFEIGCKIACRRCREAYKQGKVDGYVNGREYDAHIQGVLAEIAVAKHLGILEKWKPTINTYREVPDIEYKGKPIEVKSIGNLKTMQTKGFSIKKSTLNRQEDDLFIFVYCDIRQTSSDFKCDIIGYATTEDVKKEYSEYGWYYPLDKIKFLNLEEIAK